MKLLYSFNFSFRCGNISRAVSSMHGDQVEEEREREREREKHQLHFPFMCIIMSFHANCVLLLHVARRSTLPDDDKEIW